MKNLLILISLLSFVYLFTFSGCGEDEEIYTPPAMTNAVIKGKVECNIDFLSPGLESATQGTRIIAQINASDLVTNPIPGYPYENLTFETTVDGNGNYQISVNANTKTVNVTIICDDFLADKREQFPDSSFEYHVWKAGPFSQTVVKNVTRVLDITYN